MALPGTWIQALLEHVAIALRIPQGTALRVPVGIGREGGFVVSPNHAAPAYRASHRAAHPGGDPAGEAGAQAKAVRVGPKTELGFRSWIPAFVGMTCLVVSPPRIALRIPEGIPQGKRGARGARARW